MKTTIDKETRTAAVRLVECPRDAMQGWKTFVPTAQKTAYINSLLQVGFDTIDCGSFVSPKAIPQMSDTADVIRGLHLEDTDTRLLAIVANTRGAEEAAAFPEITYLGFPFSVSETFQQRNTNAGIAEALQRVIGIQEICARKNKQLVVYISMGFGNPYGDPYSEELVFEWVDRITGHGIGIVSLADTVGLATAAQVQQVTGYLVQSLPQTTIGVHLHSTAQNWEQKVEAAYAAGCRRFDGALMGIGGCPMANDELVGNMNTEWLIRYFREKTALPALNASALDQSLQLAQKIFTP